MTAARHPSYDPNGTIREALRAYFDAYGLGDGGYDAAYHVVKLFGVVPVLVPNPPARKAALRRHDLNHVLGGYNASGTSGEIDIAGFELGARGGCRGFWVAWLINSLLFAAGAVIRPGRLFAAWVRARDSINAYSLGQVDDALLDRRLGEVRAELRIPDGVPAATVGDGAWFALWLLGAWSLIGALAAGGWWLVAGLAGA